MIITKFINFDETIIVKKIEIAVCLQLLLGSLMFSHTVLATTAGQDNLRMVTGAPSIESDALFSTTVQWRVDGQHVIEATGLAFISGSNATKPDDAAKVATKVKSSLNDALAEKYPNSRGMEASGPKKQPELTISNKQGFSFTRVTVKNYSNSSVTFDVLGKAFSDKGIGVSIDLVYSADVAYIDAFAPPKQDFASGGTVTIIIDGGEPVVIQTKNKSTTAIEKELANAISQATFSTSSLIPHSRGGGKRNAKPFDGGEIQMPILSAKSFSVDIKDASLGVLTKFKYQDSTKPTDVAGSFKSIFALVIFAAFGYFIYTLYRDSKKKQNEEA